MKALTAFASAAALAMTLAATAAPANAAVFAQFTPDKSAMDYKWVNSGTAASPGTGGHFFSITSQSATVAQGVATHFSFLDPALSLLTFIPATFKIDATVAPGHPATMNGAGVYTQQDLNGSFSFTYTGATINNYKGSGIKLLHNSNLLSGVFTDAWIQGAGGSGSANLAIGNGGSATYASAYEPFPGLRLHTEEFAFNLLAVVDDFGTKKKPLPGFHDTTGDALDSFRANGGGNFSFQTVPEPATWGLMILGFGGVGLTLRNRRRAIRVTA
jgi:hypothetical protein